MHPTGVAGAGEGCQPHGQSGGHCRFSGGLSSPCLVLGSAPGSDPGSAGEGSELLPVPCLVPGKCPFAVHTLPAPSPPLRGGCLGPTHPGHAPHLYCCHGVVQLTPANIIDGSYQVECLVPSWMRARERKLNARRLGRCKVGLPHAWLGH